MAEQDTEKFSLMEMNVIREIIEICSRLNSKNMLASADGNVSYRVSDDHILITPTGVNKAFLKPFDMAVIDIKNRIIKGKPSGERLMHLEIYRQCPQARCIVHAHPPTATAWSVAHPEMKELPADALSEVILAVGRIPVIPYARPGTESMGESLRPFLPRSRVMILARHGALSWGESIMEAYNGMERLEHSAMILKAAYELGGITSLPTEELEALRNIRAKTGEKTL